MKVSEITSVIAKRIKEMELEEVQLSEVGVVLSVQDGVVRCTGLDGAFFEECVSIETQDGQSILGLITSLEDDHVCVMALGEERAIAEGDRVRRLHKTLTVPVGMNLLGRVVNALGEPIDGQGPIEADTFSLLEVPAPGIMDRQSVFSPVRTGVTMIDAMIPVGKGQRELIIGDRQTGKSTIAIDTILNQKRYYDDPKERIYCIYVSIGQKRSNLARLVQLLREADALKYTIVLAATASDINVLQYLAPYAGTAMGEYFRDRGMHALIVYDDLSKHAVAYRQMSLLMRRPPGREAYPGDVFYIHSRLLERSAQLSEEKGGGSLTALPMVETQGGDVSAYIPTNIISITDGQIFLESELFLKGVRPAVNVGISVSRIGSAAQTSFMKKVAGKIKLDLAQYRELQAFAQFATDMDEATVTFLQRGDRLMEVLKQPPYQPFDYNMQVWILFLATSGYFDTVPVEEIQAYKHKAMEHYTPPKDTWEATEKSWHKAAKKMMGAG